MNTNQVYVQRWDDDPSAPIMSAAAAAAFPASTPSEDEASVSSRWEAESLRLE